jgi:hypothetical protein
LLPAVYAAREPAANMSKHEEDYALSSTHGAASDRLNSFHENAAHVRVVSALERRGSKPDKSTNGSESKWQCPAHDDRTPSLSLSTKTAGRVLLHCHAGCETSVILAALNLESRDLFDSEPTGRTPWIDRLVQVYEYTDEESQTLYGNARLYPKGFLSVQPDGRGDWIPGLKGVERRVLYRLPEVIEAVAEGRPIWLTEGEKDADTLRSLGQTATTHAGGVKSWKPHSHQLRSPLAGATVNVWRDADKPGVNWSHDVVRDLREVGANFRVIEATKGKDAFDALVTHKIPFDEAYREVDISEEKPIEVTLPSDASLYDRFIPFSEIEPLLKSAYLVKGLIERNSLVVLFAPSGLTKTFVALELARCIATGRAFLGRSVHAGAVVWVAAEGARSALNRLAAIRQEKGAEASLALLPIPVDLMNREDDVNVFIASTKRLEAESGVKHEAIFLDTYSQSIVGADENAAKDSSTAIDSMNRIRRELDATVIAIAHTGKDETRGIRGSNALYNACDTVLQVSALTHAGYEILVKKQRDIEVDGDGLAYGLRIVDLGHDEESEPVTSCVVEQIEPTRSRRSSSKRLKDRDSVLLDLVKDMVSNGECSPVSKEGVEASLGHLDLGQSHVSEKSLREHFLRRLGVGCSDGSDMKPDTARKAFERGRDRLQALGYIQVLGDRIALAQD